MIVDNMEWLLLLPMPILAWIWIQLMRGEAIPYPLPDSTVREILRMARVRRRELVYDLGSGDGRVSIIAASEFGAKAVAIERNRFMAWLTKWNVKRGRVSMSVKTVRNNFFKEGLHEADVVVAYLSAKTTQKLKLKFLKELRKGTRIVSAAHPIEGWQEERKIKTGHFYSYLYRV